MSADVLLHALGLHGFQLIEAVENEPEGTLELHVARKETGKFPCPLCGSGRTIKRGRVIRRIRTVPLGLYHTVFLVFHLHRLHCYQCGRTGTQKVPVAHGKNRWSWQLAQAVLELVDKMNLKAIATHLHISWDTVRRIHRQWLLRRAQEHWKQLRSVRYLAIDEISVRRRHRYFTIVVDLDSRKPLWVGDGRGREALEPFFQWLLHRGIRPMAIAMDMWHVYTDLVMEYFPDTAILYDRFHVVSNANRAVDETRRQLVRELAAREAKAIKGCRWVLLQAPERLAKNPKAKKKLEIVAEFNKPLYWAYLLKEQLRTMWDVCRDYVEAVSYLHNWLEEALRCGVRPMVELAAQVGAHRSGILNYFLHPITTGPLEGINNKIKALKRNAYGYRDMTYFKLRILFINEAKHVFCG